MSETKEGNGTKILMIALTTLVTLLLAVVGVIGTMLINIGNGNSTAIEKQDKVIDSQTVQMALMKQSLASLQQDDKIDEGQQRQLGKQWNWLSTLHDEVNRQRFKEMLEPLARPQKDNP